MITTISEKGLAFLEAHEGVVLKAYRCPAGVWTIGAGLTAASGVVKPRAGMVITRDEARQLLAQALARNYGPRARAALGAVPQHALDGGISFDFNTGAIERASWVKAYRSNDKTRVRALLAQWRKGGGKVLPGLVRRRDEEADVILLDRWPHHLDVKIPANVAHAGIVVTLTRDELTAVRTALQDLGYDVGNREDRIRLKAVRDFQARYNLTVDGLIGRATLSTLQREIDARATAKKGGGTAATGGAVAGGNEAAAPVQEVAPDVAGDGTALVGDALVTYAGLAVIGLALIYLAWQAWQYRDIVAARLDGSAPRIARWLRSR